MNVTGHMKENARTNSGGSKETEVLRAMSSVFVSSSSSCCGSSHDPFSHSAFNVEDHCGETSKSKVCNSEKSVLSAHRGDTLLMGNTVHGPCQFLSLQEVLSHFSTVGFQASHYSKAVQIARQALERQSPSLHYAVKNGEFVEIHQNGEEKVMSTSTNDNGRSGSPDGELLESINKQHGGKRHEENHSVRPLLFLGMTAQLMGTGCREAVRFLIMEGLEPRHVQDSKKDDPSSVPSSPVQSTPHRAAVRENTPLRENMNGEKDEFFRSQVFGHSLLNKIGFRDIRQEESKEASGFLGEVKEVEKKKMHVSDQVNCAGNHLSTSTDSATSFSSLPYYSFLSCLVLSGGGAEHDLRRACDPYKVVAYASEEEKKRTNTTMNKNCSAESDTEMTNNKYVYFGNIAYAKDKIVEKESPIPPFHSLDVGKEGENLKEDIFSKEKEEEEKRKIKKGIEFLPFSSQSTNEGRTDQQHITASKKGDEKWSLMDMVMSVAVRQLLERQVRLQEQARSLPVPEDSYADICSWTITPSEVWTWIGWNLPRLFAEALARLALLLGPFDDSNSGCAFPFSPCIPTNTLNHCERSSQARGSVEQNKDSWRQLMEDTNIQREAQQRAESTVVYWAAQQGVPIFCPSFVDGDIMDYIRYASHYFSTRNLSSTSLGVLCGTSLALDLVKDIHYLNYLAMSAERTGVIICGGGVVKHHICNANLMRNGADYSIFLNNGQEYDGSDGGAHPEEALSWGKLRFDGQHVKVYGEVTTMFPLLVGEVFLPAVRNRH